MKLKKIIIILLILILIRNSVFTYSIASDDLNYYDQSFLKNNYEYSCKIINIADSNFTGEIILDQRKIDILDKNSLYLTGKIESSGNYQKKDYQLFKNINPNLDISNIDNSKNNVIINDPIFDCSFTTILGDWINLFTNLNISNNKYLIKNNYILIGNFNKTPFYAIAGKKFVKSSEIDVITEFKPSLMSSYFKQYNSYYSIGYSNKGLNVLGTIINKYNVSKDNIFNNDFVFQASYKGINDNKINYKLNFGYMNTISHTDISSFLTSENKYSAVEAGVCINKNNISFNGETILTTSRFSKIFDFNYYKYNQQENIKSWNINSSYTNNFLNSKLITHISYGQVYQNIYNYINQIQVGTKYYFLKNTWIGVNYSYIEGKNIGLYIKGYDVLSVNAGLYF